MQQALRSKSLRLKTLMCFAHFAILTASQKCPCQQAFLLLVADAGKFNNPAGSDEKCSGEKLVGPIIHCSPNLTKVKNMNILIYGKR